MRHGYRIVIWLAIVLLGACQEPLDDEQLIRQRLDEMARAVEEKKGSVFLQGIHSEFQGQQNLRRQNLPGLLLLHYRRHQQINVTLSDIQLNLSGESATVSFKATLRGDAGLLQRGRVLVIDSRWLKVDGEWLVDRARWREQR